MLIAWQTINKVHDAERRALRQAVPRRHARDHDPRPARRAAARATTTTTTASATSSRPTCGRRSSRRRSRSSTTTRSCRATPRRSRASPANTRKLLRGGKPDGRPVPRDAATMVAPGPARPSASARARSSCSTTRPTTATRTSSLEHPDDDGRARRTRSATARRRVWFRACSDPRARSASRRSTTSRPRPTTSKGSGYNEGFIFPWVVSDFSLMDAIESGIVKVPRIPVDDDAGGRAARLPPPVGQHPAAAAEARAAKDDDRRPASGSIPETLEGALRSLYRSYERDLRALGGRAGRASASRRR